MHNYNYVCTLKHKRDCTPNIDLVHKIDLLKGVSALKKPVTCRPVLNLGRGKSYVLKKVVDFL